MWSVCSNWSALLLEGGHYNIQGLAGGGYYSRVASDRGNTVAFISQSICIKDEWSKCSSQVHFLLEGIGEILARMDDSNPLVHPKIPPNSVMLGFHTVQHAASRFHAGSWPTSLCLQL